MVELSLQNCLWLSTDALISFPDPCCVTCVDQTDYDSNVHVQSIQKQKSLLATAQYRSRGRGFDSSIQGTGVAEARDGDSWGRSLQPCPPRPTEAHPSPPKPTFPRARPPLQLAKPAGFKTRSFPGRVWATVSGSGMPKTSSHYAASRSGTI